VEGTDSIQYAVCKATTYRKSTSDQFYKETFFLSDNFDCLWESA